MTKRETTILLIRAAAIYKLYSAIRLLSVIELQPSAPNILLYKLALYLSPLLSVVLLWLIAKLAARLVFPEVDGSESAPQMSFQMAAMLAVMTLGLLITINSIWGAIGLSSQGLLLYGDQPASFGIEGTATRFYVLNFAATIVEAVFGLLILLGARKIAAKLAPAENDIRRGN